MRRQEDIYEMTGGTSKVAPLQRTCLKVIHLHFKQPMNGKQDYYFGSKAAIYEVFSTEHLGISLGSLYTKRIDKEPYFNKLCTIRESKLITKKKKVGDGVVD